MKVFGYDKFGDSLRLIKSKFVEMKVYNLKLMKQTKWDTFVLKSSVGIFVASRLKSSDPKVDLRLGVLIGDDEENLQMVMDYLEIRTGEDGASSPEIRPDLCWHEQIRN
ncbi:hypothetical protein L1887_15106 [Cichorium endivia]|nr:hypothetical protein L1887_15106 [Cichorium endivia]